MSLNFLSSITVSNWQGQIASLIPVLLKSSPFLPTPPLYSLFCTGWKVKKEGREERRDGGKEGEREGGRKGRKNRQRGRQGGRNVQTLFFFTLLDCRVFEIRTILNSPLNSLLRALHRGDA